jgi:tetratricopeptide (TPR) repeat protein
MKIGVGDEPWWNMKCVLQGRICRFALMKILFAFCFFIISVTAFSQKTKLNKDSLAVRDSIREFMYRGALLSMDALQSKYESQKTTDPTEQHQKMGQSQNLFFQSRAYYRKAIKFDGNYFLAWSGIGNDYLLQDLPKAAIPCYKKALTINPSYAPGWFNLGKAYVSISGFDSAEYAFRESIHTDSSYLQSYQALSRLLVAQKKDTKAALELLQTCLAHCASSEVPYVEMASIYFSMNDSVKGIDCTEKAAAVYSGDLQRLDLLRTYFKQHNDPKKAAYYETLFAAEQKKLEIPGDPDK